MKPADPRHGTRNGYANLGCRCERCREANTEYSKRPHMKAARLRYLRKRGHRPWSEYVTAVEAKHGTESRYNRRGCRCMRCRAASAAARKKRRDANLDASRKYAREYKRRVREASR